jgi:hypothetical protein
MKQKLTVNNQMYEVEIEDINARPVIVHVDGVRFEVMPEKQIRLKRRKKRDAKTESKAVQAESRSCGGAVSQSRFERQLTDISPAWNRRQSLCEGGRQSGGGAGGAGDRSDENEEQHPLDVQRHDGEVLVSEGTKRGT